MSLQWQRNDEGRIALQGDLTRQTVPEFWQQRRQWLVAGRPLELEMQAVEHVDSAGVALLIEVKRALKDASLTLQNPSKQLVDIAHVSGVHELLSLS